MLIWNASLFVTHTHTTFRQSRAKRKQKKCNCSRLCVRMAKRIKNQRASSLGSSIFFLFVFGWNCRLEWHFKKNFYRSSISLTVLASTAPQILKINQEKPPLKPYRFPSIEFFRVHSRQSMPLKVNFAVVLFSPAIHCLVMMSNHCRRQPTRRQWRHRNHKICGTISTHKTIPHRISDVKKQTNNCHFVFIIHKVGKRNVFIFIKTLNICDSQCNIQRRTNG